MKKTKKYTGPLTTIRSTYRLFKQPDKIGDIIEIDGNHYLILGIERFKLCDQKIEMFYTAQNLAKSDFISKQRAFRLSHQLEFEVRVNHNDNRRLSFFDLGSTFVADDGEAYKAYEYTDIEFDGTDVILSFIARPVFPIDRKEAKAKLFSERRKKLKLIGFD
jgi:hypothetical protein